MLSSLEFLGDCFLKMATSLSVYVQQPEENEFEFHVRRMEMLCNKNLMETAVGKKKVVAPDGSEHDIQLYKYIRTDSFSRYVTDYVTLLTNNYSLTLVDVRGILKASSFLRARA